MQFKWQIVFVFIAIASALVALVRIALGHDVMDASNPNIAIGSICLACMVILSYKERRKTIG